MNPNLFFVVLGSTVGTSAFVSLVLYACDRCRRGREPEPYARRIFVEWQDEEEEMGEGRNI